MTIEEMKAKKAELGYTNETVSSLSGVPLGTVQKIFAGETKSPRYDTIVKLQNVFGFHSEYTLREGVRFGVAEAGYAYNAGSVNSSGNKNNEPLPIKPKKTKLGMFEGKYKMPPDELLFGDDLSDLFEDI